MPKFFSDLPRLLASFVSQSLVAVVQRITTPMGTHVRPWILVLRWLGSWPLAPWVTPWRTRMTTTAGTILTTAVTVVATITMAAGTGEVIGIDTW